MTLSELKTLVDSAMEAHGPNAPCAASIWFEGDVHEISFVKNHPEPTDAEVSQILQAMQDNFDAPEDPTRELFIETIQEFRDFHS